MFGIILVSLSALLSEIAITIGKDKIKKHQESIYSMGFLNLFWGAVFLVVIGILRNHFIFSLASLPTFLTRAVLEIILAHAALTAIAKASRSTFSFLRIVTIPLLLLVDLVLGYPLNAYQIGGIILIVFVLLFLFMNHGIEKKGRALTLFAAVMAVATLSLYKYNITHFNSVEAEQSLIQIILLIYFLWRMTSATKEKPWKLLTKRIFFFQSLSEGLAAVLGSFAYAFAPASIILTAQRSISTIWAVVSGGLYFHEKHILIKVCALIVLIGGIILLIL